MKQRAIDIKHYLLQDINPVIRILIISDTIIYGGTGLLGPIFALFITDFIQGGNAAVAGLAAAIYLASKSVLQIPIATFIDRIRGEKDDYYLLIASQIVISLVPLLYLVIDTPIQLYVAQFILGAATAFTYPTWMAIFTRHIDKSKEGTEWGVYFTLTDLSNAAFAAIGGYMATVEGFATVIIAVVVISVFGTLLVPSIRPYLRNT